MNIKQNRPRSIESAIGRLLLIFPKYEEIFLKELTQQQGLVLHHRLFEKYKVATHRHVPTKAKTFLTWCVKNKWISKNPFQEIEGQGKCNKGKKQLRFDEATTWMTVALELAEKQIPGAIAGLLTLLLGLRASEIVSLVVRDVDDKGKILWSAPLELDR